MKLLAAILLLLAAPAAYADVRPGTDPLQYSGPAWSPYLVGAGIGALSWLTFRFSNKPIGASSFYATLAGMIGRIFLKKHTDSLDYYQKTHRKPIGHLYLFALRSSVHLSPRGPAEKSPGSGCTRCGLRASGTAWRCVERSDFLAGC